MKNILVVAVHPDDETLGCGGTLLRYVAEGSSIHWLVMTTIYSHANDEFYTLTSTGQKKTWANNYIEPLPFSEDKVAKRSSELSDIRQAYDFDTVHELCLPAMCLDQIPLGMMISSISKVMNNVQPDAVILPFQYDVHSDHRLAFDAAYSCTKSFRYPFIKKILMMETISETEFAPGRAFCPNMFVDISSHIDQKIKIMSIYEGETGKHPFPRSREHIKALALRRGATANCDFAESFVVLKEIM